MARKIGLAFVAAGLIAFSLVGDGIAAEKVRYSVAVRTAAAYAIPVYAAEEKGFWKQQGLEVEWTGFRGTGEVYRAVMANQIDMGSTSTMGSILSQARGIPTILVASLNMPMRFSLWVLTDSPLRGPKDLKGAKLVVTSLHDLTGAYGRMLQKALGFEMKLVAAGGSLERLAALIAKRVDGNIAATSGIAPLVVEGKLRAILHFEDYTPQPWNQYHVFSRNDVARDKAPLVRKVVRGMLNACDFVRQNPNWALDAMMSRFKFSRAAAQLVFDDSFSKAGGEGTTSPKLIENVVNFLLEYDLLGKDKAPALEEIYTNKFVQ